MMTIERLEIAARIVAGIRAHGDGLSSTGVVSRALEDADALLAAVAVEAKAETPETKPEPLPLPRVGDEFEWLNNGGLWSVVYATDEQVCAAKPTGYNSYFSIEHDWNTQRVRPVGAWAERLAAEKTAKPTVREACRRRMPLDGSDAKALEHAITITERERDALKEKLATAEKERDSARALLTIARQDERKALDSANRYAEALDDISELLNSAQIVAPGTYHLELTDAKLVYLRKVIGSGGSDD